MIAERVAGCGCRYIGTAGLHKFEKGEVLTMNAVAEKDLLVPQVVPKGEVAHYQEPAGYHAGFTQEDMKIPRIMLMQPISDAVIAEEARAGEFINSVTREKYGKELELIVLTRRDREVVKGKSLFIDKKLACWSMNRVEGLGDPGGFCGSCAEGQWGPNNEPPRCFDQYTYLTFIPGAEDDLPAALMLGKTSMGAARSFNLMLKGMFNAQIRGKKPAFGTVFKLASEKKSNEKGTFYVNIIKKSRPATDEEMELAAGLYDEFSNVDLGTAVDNNNLDDDLGAPPPNAEPY